jgi:23S rRNA (cytosine1962-C5)-methyltransferase
MILKITKQNDYELIDSGEGMKIERFGNFIFKRPDPEALWPIFLSCKDWDRADLEFKRKGNRTNWIIKENTPKDWIIEYGGFNFIIKPTSFKHTGLFPEQLANWQWMEEIITNYQLLITNEKSFKDFASKKIKVLNLFAYTGGATLVCAKAGAEVCHVDASKQAVSWARENAKISGLEDKPIRWIVDDVLLFLKREVKRGNKYDAIIMDPPAFGHGPNDELWKIEENFLELIKLCKELLSNNPIFILINGYTAGYSPIVFENNLKWMMNDFKGEIESGELVIEESNSNRLLPCGIFARWRGISF